MTSQLETEHSFVNEINSKNIVTNFNAIAYALATIEKDDNRIDFEDLIAKYVENPKLEGVLNVMNPFEVEGFEEVFIQEDRDLAHKQFADFVSFDGYSDAQRIITEKLAGEKFFDVSYALAVNTMKSEFSDLNPVYVQEKMKLDDIKAIIGSFDDALYTPIDGRTINLETKIFLDIVKKSSSEENVINAFRCYKFAIDCVMGGKDIAEVLLNVKRHSKINARDLKEIQQKLSGNTRKIHLSEYADRQNKIQENMEKRQKLPKFAWNRKL